MSVIAFVNAGSGDNKGETVIKILSDIIGEANVHDIKKDGGPDKGLELHCSDPSKEVTAMVAGGDGTFSWVATSVERQNLRHVRLTLIPLGSGNDMSRALGWGRKYPGDSAIKNYVEWIKTSPKHTLDVWKLNAVEDEEKVKASKGKDVVGHSARAVMCNYLSLGADAYVEMKFNQLRWNKPDKYKSRIGNFVAHIKVGAKYLVRPRSRKFFMNDHIETLVVDGKTLELPANLQALIILNIPSYGAGTQPWGFTKEKDTSDVLKGVAVKDMLVNDGNFEVIGLRGLPHFGTIKIFQATGVRIAQGQSLQITLKSDATPFQVDGEPWQQRGGTVSVEKGNSVGVLAGPVWKEGSRKSAKFAEVQDEGSVGEDDSPPPQEGESRGFVRVIENDDDNGN